jgi:hypothetical protein
MTKPSTSAAKLSQLEQAREEAKQLKAAREQREREAQAAQHAQAMPQPVHADNEDLIGSFELPSWKRVVVGIVLGLTGAGFVGYGIGMIMAYALAGIATLAGTGAIAFILSVLVWVIGIYASWKIGGYVGGKIFASVVLPDGLASRSMASLSNAVSGAGDRVRNSSIVQRASAITGAHVKAA